jgi:hypothetical protein
MAVAHISDEILLRSVLSAFGDHPKLCENALTIRNKSGQTVPLILTGPQRRMVETVRQRRRIGRPVRIVALKARQIHMSVAVASIIWREIAFLPGQHAVCMGDVYRTSANLWSYYQQFQESYKPYLGIKQLEAAGQQKGKKLEWAGDSWAQFGSAEAATSGRSYSIRHLHLSEYAFYGDAATLMTGLMQSVPDDPGTTVIVESTANGLGGEFYDLWQRANDPQRCGDWVPLFVGWHEHPEYQTPLADSREAFYRSLNQEERILYEQHRCTLEQLFWRRNKIATACEGSVERFHQEYPSTPEEAFLVSGRPVFNGADLALMPIDRAPITGRLRLTEDFPARRIVLEPAELGELTVFRRPDRTRAYAIGVDTARGIDRGTGGAGKSDPDYCAAQVLDIDTGEQVASLRGRFSPAHWAEQVSTLGKWFNTAFLVPEANENGLAVIEHLLTLGYPIAAIYKRKRMPDDRGPLDLHELGWWTDTRTRPQLVNTLGNAIREQAIVIRKAHTLQECLTFIYKPTGKAEAQNGCHDDEVMALALAVVGMIVAPRDVPKAEGQRPAKPVQSYGRRRTRNEDD